MKSDLSRCFAGPSRRRRDRARARQLVEGLEDRAVPAVCNVNSLADVLTPRPGVVTLRPAIRLANATPGSRTRLSPAATVAPEGKPLAPALDSALGARSNSWTPRGNQA
jgi:hypothetical protein